MHEKLKIFLMRHLTGPLIHWKWRGARATALSVHDETLAVDGGTIAARIYTPRGKGPFPILHFFHGGGWVFGDLETHDPLCRELCVQAGYLVVAVDYRLAPEYPFPVPVQDALASLDWVHEHAVRLGGDPGYLVLCGDSAGGNLAAIAAQQARSRHPGLVKGQVLIYPVTDHCAHASRNSYRKFGGKSYGLSLPDMTLLWEIYLRGSPLWPAGTTRHELATPLHTQDLGGIPRTLMILAEEDVLHDEGTDYAERLERAGADVQVRQHAGQRHGFVGTEPSPACRQAIGEIVDWLRRTDG